MDFRIGVCVLSWNSRETLIPCINGLLVSGSGLSDIVVVDNASTDRSIETLRRHFPSVYVIENARNTGYAAGNNLGAEFLLHQGCEILLFVNADVTVLPDTIGAMVSCLLQNSGAGAVGGLCEGTKRSLAARTRPSAIEKIVYYGFLNRLPVIRNLARNHVLDVSALADGAEVYAVSGACIAFRSIAFREAGGFDESTFLYEEEFIMAERLRAHGWKIILSKEARYGHKEGASTNLIPYRRRLHFIASEQHLLSRYYEWNWILCRVLMFWRLLEWAVYALRWSLTHA